MILGEFEMEDSVPYYVGIVLEDGKRTAQFVNYSSGRVTRCQWIADKWIILWDSQLQLNPPK